MNEVTKSIIEKVNCPHQVFSEQADVNDVRKAYEEALKKGQKQGFVPVLVVSDDTLEEWLGILEDDEYQKEEVIKEAADRGKEILAERYQEYMEDYEGEEEEWKGEMKDGDSLTGLTSFMKLEGDGIKETILFEIPVKNPWEVIAYVPMGGWNECPEALEMMEVCRYWYETYHAFPAVFSHDELEFYVGKISLSEQEAWDLAKEHYAFSPDRVDQCTADGTLGELADCIRKSTVWYFWWD